MIASGKAARDGDGHRSARSQHAGQLAHGRSVVGDVLEHLRRDDAVEGPVRERQRQRIALDRRGRVIGSQLADLDHGADRRPDLGHLIGTGIERDDRSSPPRCFEGVASETASEVEQQVARADPQPVVVDGQHEAAPTTAGPAGTTPAPGSGRPSRRA